MIYKTTDVCQLATWCSVYKKELDRKRSECKQLSDDVKKRKKDSESLSVALNNQTLELKAAKDHIKSLDEDVLRQSQQIIRLKEKIILLEVCI